MNDYTNLIATIEKTGSEIYWLGSATDDQIKILEDLLEFNLPASFKEFLKLYGGGGVVEAEISGIENNDALNDSGGTVYGDTLTVREDYQLPEKLAVIFFRDDEVCWCIDASNSKTQDEFPIVSYNLFSRKVDRKISDSFENFFEEYLTLRSKP
ncbi:SMI1 / KNR4 family protein [Marinomonas spartinae]|uniref:SMI1 / KNR4 family protein n=1 Tax=Marinomonas spartinae TaxID=1792290 RepID=A0A1A8TPQ1_9GAMM|nr:SMI1/KNR4 family protein [Marinomonas spartinae]SBS34727.1 SMI1 / KNR4 family protein [Marinomonas spartinae]